VGVAKGGSVLIALGVLVGVGVTWLTAERQAKTGITRTIKISFNRQAFIEKQAPYFQNLRHYSIHGNESNREILYITITARLIIS
jgi:hypothetical protein